MKMFRVIYGAMLDKSSWIKLFIFSPFLLLPSEVFSYRLSSVVVDVDKVDVVGGVGGSISKILTTIK